jgi:Ca2+/H+ antiporter
VPAVVVITAIAVVLTGGLGVEDGVALFYYAGVSSARLVQNGWAYRAIAAISLLAAGSLAVRSGDPTGGLVVGFTVGTISVTLASLSALARSTATSRRRAMRWPRPRWPKSACGSRGTCTTRSATACR